MQGFVFAGKGLKWVLVSQRNMRIHLAAGTLALAASVWLGLDLRDTALLVFAAALVMVAEMVNSAIEKVVDLVTPDYHPLAGMAKDAAAGAVMLAAFFSVIIGLLVFFPYVKELLLEMLF